MTPTAEKSILIREIKTVAEMRAVEEMQKEVWGVPDIEVVPASHLTAAVTAGGVLLGAFDGDRLVGFVYGFVSFERGQTAHHSHMLAVKPEYRNYKLGEKLKLAQREAVSKQGIKLISWTFDPLQSLNAYFNFNKLGVVSDTYFIDFYGDDAPSFLHQNGTDRLWVIWELASARAIERVNKTAAPTELGAVEKLVECGEDGAILVSDTQKVLLNERVAIDIPADINSLQGRNTGLASWWRDATREAFTSAIEAGFIVKEFYRGSRNGQQYGTYLLVRERGIFEYEKE